MIGLHLALADLRFEWADTLSRSLALAAGLLLGAQLLGLQAAERPAKPAVLAQGDRQTAAPVDPPQPEPSMPGPADQLVRLSDPLDRGQAILARITAGPEGDLAADEIRVTERLARRLGLEEGHVVTATLSDDAQAARTSLPLRVVAVVPAGTFKGNRAIASPALVGAMAAYRRGEGIAAWGIVGKPGPYSGNIALAPTPLATPEPAAAPEPSDEVVDAPSDAPLDAPLDERRSPDGGVIIATLAALGGFWGLHSVAWARGLVARKRRALSSLLMMGCVRRDLLLYGTSRALLPLFGGAVLAAGLLPLFGAENAWALCGLVASALLIGLFGSLAAFFVLAPADGVEGLAGDADARQQR